MSPLPKKIINRPFLYDYQMDAVSRMFTGCILNGGTGSGKSRTGLYYYFTKMGGKIGSGEYVPMKNPKDLYIITTAMKRDKLEWDGELANFCLAPDKKHIIIDSWNNIKKYNAVKDAFFIFDEDRVQGNGVWAKTFLKIARNNDWIILSATSGDRWEDYIYVFVANGFYKNPTEFRRSHMVYASYSTFPKVIRYNNTGRLIRLRNKILIDMDYIRATVSHHEDIFTQYDAMKYKMVMRTRWDPYKDEPISQAAGLCYVLRRIVNTDESRIAMVTALVQEHDRCIIFYNFDYELEILKGIAYDEDVVVAQWNGHRHEEIPKTKKWVYLVQYNAGCEGWNSITTDTIIFYSQNYSYKVMTQAAGRIDRLNTPFKDLYYYHLKSKSSIDLAISRALATKKLFNERKFAGF